ncbi:uncharacterized protein LOC126670788 [Mercurialis annua]|uniref:uncharacterized protein LOC126670788 n=1 Tax=Mercurialis annua TaxID=3986 RepID=UPI00215FFE58|nr:uncharacterized protein LOC126670788 [Mercurialis annua]
MAMEPPSFSLGLDLELESEPEFIPENPPPTQLQQQVRQHYSAINVGSTSGPLLNDGNDDFGLQVMDSDPESGPSSPRVFKRLRKGPGSAINELEVKKRVKEEQVFSVNNGDDDIEEFSSQEDFIIKDAYPSAEHTSVCSSSKVPLRSVRIQTTQSLNQLKEKKKASDAPFSSSLQTGHNGLIFPNLTISPLRRFQLIDSDSEEPSMIKNVSRKVPTTDSSSKDHKSASYEQKRNLVTEKHRNEDLWKDFCPKKSSHVPTPVLDEVCKEYFQSLRDKDSAQKLGTGIHRSDNIGYHPNKTTITGFEQSWNSVDPLPPAHHYFFHHDSRIQSLVRRRLPNFSPLGTVNNRENHQPSEPVINYMSQFNAEASKQKRTQTNNNGKGSKGGRSRSKKSNSKEAPQSSQGWVDPKRSAAIPKDAGKRRVQANGQAAGHWFTSPEGKKVYISRTGQELTGQMAYRHYKKESGGSRKSRKKTNVKRKKKG